LVGGQWDLKVWLAVLSSAILSAVAKAEPARMPVIVVFKEGAPVHQFAPHFRVDARSIQQAGQWNYLKVQWRERYT